MADRRDARAVAETATEIQKREAASGALTRHQAAPGERVLHLQGARKVAGRNDPVNGARRGDFLLTLPACRP